MVLGFALICHSVKNAVQSPGASVPARDISLCKNSTLPATGGANILTVMGNGSAWVSKERSAAYPERESESDAQSARHSKVERRAFNALGRLGWRVAPVKWRSSPASIHNPIRKKCFIETDSNRFCPGDTGSRSSWAGTLNQRAPPPGDSPGHATPWMA